MNRPDEWPPKRARSREDWDAYWARQRWDRRLRRLVIRPFLARLKRRLMAPRGWWRTARWFVQRGRRGWADRDTWGMDDYITRVAGQMAAYMNEHRHGYKCQAVTDCWKQNPKACSCADDWAATLDSIAGPLVAYRTHWEHLRDAETEERIIAAGQDAFRLLAEHLPALWD